MEYEKNTLSNGLRVFHVPVKSPVSHIGLFINAGTRDELPDENGLAHFIEHTIFKGTKNRKAYHILSRLETVGGELNAFTTKEETCIYATVLNEHLLRAMELISDILLNSTFPEKELNKEKEVILDEINSYKDSPSEEIYDVFEENLFKGHPLGMNILGTPEHLKEFNRTQAQNFLEQHYSSGKMALCIVGERTADGLYPAMEKYFGTINNREGKNTRVPFQDKLSFSKYEERNTFQTHTILGGTAFDRKDGRRTTMFMLNNILGGPALNSRLNLAVRERYGFTYNIESVYLPYTDTGVFSIYMGTDNGNLDKALSLVMREMEKIRKVPMGILQLSQAKKQLLGQIAIANESNLNKMLSFGKAFLHDGRVDTMEEMRKKIEKVSVRQLMDVADEVFSPDKLSLLVFRNRVLNP